MRHTKGLVREMSIYPITLTIVNYRSFGPDNPLVIQVGDCFTGFVGPNNSGKSNALKFFSEYQDLWRKLSTTENIRSLLDNPHMVAVSEVRDRDEVFTRQTDGPMIVGIRTSANTGVGSVKIRIARDHNVTFDEPVALANAVEKSLGSTGNEMIVDRQHLDLSPIIKLASDLSRILYIPAFRNAILQSSGTYYGLSIGHQFIQQWDNWKTGPNLHQNRRIRNVIADLKAIFGFKSLDIGAAADNQSLLIDVDGEPYGLGELGSGFSEFMIVLGNAAIRQPSFIMIDEPELHLHPKLQIDFLTSLASYASHGILFGTHSIGLARASCDYLYSLRLNPNGLSICTQYEELGKNLAEFAGQMGFAAIRETGVNTILLVEGPSEVRVVHQWLRKLDKGQEAVLIPLCGDSLIHGGVVQELQVLCRLAENVVALIDSEKESETAPMPKNRADFADACAGAGVRFKATERRATENYFPTSAVQAVLGDGFEKLGPFDNVRDTYPAWKKRINWKIAREMTLDDLCSTDIGEFLESL